MSPLDDNESPGGSALFSSEKTVSVHVSNLLRKTGTSSRREVSALAHRVGYVASPAE